MTLVTEKPGINATMLLLTLVPAFPAALTLTAPVVPVTATPGITSRVLPALKTRYILTATLAHQGTAHHVPKDIQQLHPKFVPVARYLESATNVK